MMTPHFTFQYGGKEFFSLNPTVFQNGDETVYTLTDGLTVTLKKQVYPEFNACEWVLFFANNGIADSQRITNLSDCAVTVPLGKPNLQKNGLAYTPEFTRVITMHGCVSGGLYIFDDATASLEYQHHDRYLRPNETFTASNNLLGRPTDGEYCPYFDIREGKNGALMAIGWTGNWQASFSRTEDGVTVQSGLPELDFYLHREEEIRTTATLIMDYEDCDRAEASNRFRRLMRTHFSPKHRLLAFELWGGLNSDEMIRRLQVLKARKMPIEQTWLDAGWFGNALRSETPFAPEWAEQTGTWTVNPNCHPDGLKDVTAQCLENKMPMMLWIEPERCRVSRSIAQEHPEYFLPHPNPDDGNYLINYGSEEAWNYIYEMICHYAESCALSCFRQDFNMCPTPYWQLADKADGRIGLHEIRHVMGMYRLWDALHERFPNLIIDNCASGGRRFDFEAVRRSVSFFRSDFQCNFNAEPDVLQCHHVGSAYYLPEMGCTSKIADDTYALRSAYAPSFGVACWNAVFQHLDENGLDWLYDRLTEYVAIRDFLSEDFYNHGAETIEPTAWAIHQYHRPSVDDGCVLAFRRKASPFDRVSVALRGLSPEKNYLVTNMDTHEQYTVSGKVGTLEIYLPERRSSVILQYKAK